MINSNTALIPSGTREPNSKQIPSYRVAVVNWTPERDGLSQIIHDELTRLGHDPICFLHDTPIPKGVDVVFSYAPYGEFIKLPYQLARLSAEKRPLFVHWNTEGCPDLRMPWPVVRTLAAARSWIGRLRHKDNPALRTIGTKLTSSWQTRMLRFRYVGDYYYTYRKGWLDVFADSSAVYAQRHTAHGLPTVVAPWGATPRWYADLKLKRDIDVLWMGQRASGRRSKLLDDVRAELGKHGVDVYMADNEENPFIFGDERTQFLNRAKITLNLTRTWYDDNFSRFAIAAPNRSLIVSEAMLPHCPQFLADIHYASAPAEKLADTILYYLANEEERLRLVDSAYQLVTKELTFFNSIKTIMTAVHQKHLEKSS